MKRSKTEYVIIIKTTNGNKRFVSNFYKLNNMFHISFDDDLQWATSFDCITKARLARYRILSEAYAHYSDEDVVIEEVVCSIKEHDA